MIAFFGYFKKTPDIAPGAFGKIFTTRGILA